jgi:hypothetical protein
LRRAHSHGPDKHKPTYAATTKATIAHSPRVSGGAARFTGFGLRLGAHIVSIQIDSSTVLRIAAAPFDKRVEKMPARGSADHLHSAQPFGLQAWAAGVQARGLLLCGNASFVIAQGVGSGLHAVNPCAIK